MSKISKVYREIGLPGGLHKWRQAVGRLLIAVEKRTGLVDRLGLLSYFTPDEQMEIIIARSKDLVQRLRRKASMPRILFVAPRGSYYDLVLQSCFAYRLMYDGAYCSFLICQNLPKCQVGDIQIRRSPNICLECEQRNIHFLNVAGLPYVRVNDFVSDVFRIKVKAMVSGLTLQDCQRFKYKSYSLGKILHIAVARYLLRATFDEKNEKATEIYRDFLYGGIVLLETYLALIAQDKPDVMVMVNGKLLWSAVAQAVASRLGIRTVSYEDISTRFMGRTWVFSHNKPIVNLDFSNLWSKYNTVALTKRQNQRLDGYLNMRRRPGYYYRRMESDIGTIKSILELRGNEKPVTLFTNITWDSTALDRDIVFDSMIKWVFDTIKYFVHSNYSLIIRIHPAEKVAFDGVQSRERIADVIAANFGKLPHNIKIVDSESPISSYALLELSRAAVVYTSTIGFEAVLSGMPAIVVGDAHYRGKGYTYDVKSLSQYHELLKKIDTLTMFPSQIELARRYAYLYFFQLPIQIDLWESHHPHGIDFLKINRLHDLAPGKISNLDMVAEGILHQKDIVIHR